MIYRVAQKSPDTPCLTTERPYTKFIGQNIQAHRDELGRLSVEKKDTLKFSDGQ